MSYKYHLSNWVELLEHPKKGFGWRFQGRSNDRPDKSFYINKDEALKAAAIGLKRGRENVEIVVDEPPVTMMGLKRVEIIHRGAKRQKTAGHGFTGGNGFKRI